MTMEHLRNFLIYNGAIIIHYGTVFMGFEWNGIGFIAHWKDREFLLLNTNENANPTKDDWLHFYKAISVIEYLRKEYGQPTCR